MQPSDMSDGDYDGASHHARLLALGAALGSALHSGAPYPGIAPPPGRPIAMLTDAAGAGAADGADCAGQAEVARMSSRYVGVHRSGKKRKPWTAACYWNGKQHHLGYYKTEEEAASAYDAYVKERGLERRVNFPEEGADDKVSAADAKASSKVARGVASRFAGVHHSRSNAVRPWRASCMSKRKYYHLGIYATEEEAALAYDAFIIEHNLGRELNFPQYRHMLQLGAAGAQSLGSGQGAHLAQLVQQIGGPAVGAPLESQHVNAMPADVAVSKPVSWQQQLQPSPQLQLAPGQAAVARFPIHPSFSSLMGQPQHLMHHAAQAQHAQAKHAQHAQPPLPIPLAHAYAQQLQQPQPVRSLPPLDPQQLQLLPPLDPQGAPSHSQGTQPVGAQLLQVQALPTPRVHVQPQPQAQPQLQAQPQPQPQLQAQYGGAPLPAMHWSMQFAQPPQQIGQPVGGHYVWVPQ
ncbi:hypothetical protein KFE25_014433 [Diacronema lutheri]|uniref:AP2/ERF domain-containing protein n=1 Tax=Diacronema lutheri TaxID=2081491 RepID=A0A8J5XAY2_DIALT|nr:hypothetical protein KFE25_014433 [Diacronema lutheri]